MKNRSFKGVTPTRKLSWLGLSVYLSCCMAHLFMARDALADMTLAFGVYAADKPSTVVQQFRPLLDALEPELTRHLNQPVKISINVASHYEQGIEDLVSGKVIFSRLGPASYILSKRALPSLRLLTMESNKGTLSFNGVIAVSTDSAVRDIADLRGRSFAFGDDQSTIGRYLSQLLLLEQGIKASDLKNMVYLDRHDAVGEAVASGRFDAGALKEGTLKQLVGKGRPLRVLATFPNVTKPWAAHPSMPESVFQALRTSMLNLKDEEAFKRLASDGADGFAVGDDAEYARIQAAINRNAEFFQ